MFKVLRKAYKNQKGFTLVELMVVVVIIGILTAIAVPVYNNVTENAANTAHDANIRIIQGAVEMYRAANNALPTKVDDLVDDYIAEWPTVPAGASDGRTEADYLNAGGILETALTTE